MRIWKAIGLGALLWVLIFFEVSILMFGFKLATTNPFYYVIHYLFLAISTIVLSLIYFSGKKKTKDGFFRGLLLGVIFIIFGLILDAIITVPLFILPQGGSYHGFFNDYYMLFGYIIVIVFAGIVGAVKKRK
jgi:hypothetical protein